MSAAKPVVLGMVLGGLGLAVAAALTVPQCVDWFQGRHEQDARYATGSEAKGDRASVPRWLPDGATSVRYRISTTGGDRLLKATLPGGKLPRGCKPATSGHRARLKADWFPKGTDTRTNAMCGIYSAVLDGTDFYAWQNHADWVKANKSGLNTL